MENSYEGTSTLTYNAASFVSQFSCQNSDCPDLQSCINLCSSYPECGGFDFHAEPDNVDGIRCRLKPKVNGGTEFAETYEAGVDVGSGEGWKLYLNERSPACQSNFSFFLSRMFHYLVRSWVV